MAIEAKASVAVDSLTEADAGDLFRLFGYEPESIVRIFGGYASSNFKAVGRPLTTSATTAGTGEPPEPELVENVRTFLLKVSHYSIELEDLNHQIFVMSHLKGTAFPTNYPHVSSDGAFLVDNGSRRAMLLDFIPGIAGDKLLAQEDMKTSVILEELSATLARLHEVAWPEEMSLRDIRSGYPVCNTGDLLRGEEMAKLRENPDFSNHPFVAFVQDHIEWLRELYSRSLPWGLIHGDAFLDNTLYDAGQPATPECKLLALIDWEDSCVGPFVLDLAVCASACCFTATNDLIRERLLVILRAYMSRRALLAEERAAFVEFMAAGALACGFYRFTEFNVRQPESDAQAKDSYKIMFERAKCLLGEGETKGIVSAVLEEALS